MFNEQLRRLVHRGLNMLFHRKRQISVNAKTIALTAIGRFTPSDSEVSAKHDDYLSEAFAGEEHKAGSTEEVRSWNR